MRQSASRRSASSYSDARAAFTLIELLFVVLVVAILASIAIRKFRTTKERAYIAEMKADLRNLATSAESRYELDGTYANVVVPQGSPGVTTTITLGVTEWTASATHANSPGITCTLSVGGAAELIARNEPVCL